MSLLNRKPDNHFSAYTHDNALLIQFIIMEFVHIHPLIFNLKKLTLKKLKKDFPLVAEELKGILAPLIEFHPQTHTRSAGTRGSLSRLKDYCEKFAHNCPQAEKLHIDLHMAAHQALLFAIHTLELLNRATHPSTNHDSDLQPLKLSLDNLLKRFKLVSKSIPPLFSPYLSNENVLLCLLRIKAQLSEIYGPNFLKKPFKSLLKEEELSHFLMSRYKERGFESLLPTIQQAVAS